MNESKAVEKPKRKLPAFLHPTPDSWIGAIVAALIAIPATTLIVNWINDQPTILEYETGSVFSYKGDKEEFGIFQVTVKKSGAKLIEGIVAEIELPKCTIQDLKAEPSILNATVEIDPSGNKAKISVPTLNPKEGAEIAIKASHPDDIPNSRSVAVRGKGITGKASAATGPINHPTHLDILGLIVAVASLIAAFVMEGYKVLKEILVRIVEIIPKKLEENLDVPTLEHLLKKKLDAQSNSSAAEGSPKDA